MSSIGGPVGGPIGGPIGGVINVEEAEAAVQAPPGHPIGAGITRLTSTSEYSALHPIFESQITG